MSHPLYPLLAVLLQQCEQASVCPDSPPSLDTFTEELRTYIQRQVTKEEQTDFEDAISPAGKYLKTNISPSIERSSNRQLTNRYPHHYTKHELRKCGHSDYRTADVGRRQDPTENNSTEYTCEMPNSTSSDNLNSIDSERKLNVFTNDLEMDKLIIKAIQVLRIHLMELHKVNELCKDFCSRYIHSLKTKFQSDPFIQDSQPSSPGDSEVPSPNPLGMYGSRYFSQTNTGLLPPFMCHSASDLVSDPQFTTDYGHRSVNDQDPMNSSANISPSQSGAYQQSSGIVNGHTTNYPQAAGPDGLCYTPNCHLTDYNSAMINFHPNKDDSDDAGGGAMDPFNQFNPFLSHYGVGNAAAIHARLDGLCVGGKQKRGVLPKRATQIMKQWLFQHLVHPYPTEDEKRHIANQTNLTLLQVNNWFINARRRILQPMLDASNFVPLTNHVNGSHDSSADGGHDNDTPVINKKKKAATSRPSNNRFWPASLVAAAAIHPVAAGLVSTATSAATTNTNTTTSGYDVSHCPINKCVQPIDNLTVADNTKSSVISQRARSTVADTSNLLGSSVHHPSSCASLSSSSKYALDERGEVDEYQRHWGIYSSPSDHGAGGMLKHTDEDLIISDSTSQSMLRYQASSPQISNEVAKLDESLHSERRYSSANVPGILAGSETSSHRLDPRISGVHCVGSDPLHSTEAQSKKSMSISPDRLKSFFTKPNRSHQLESLSQPQTEFNQILPFNQPHISDLTAGSEISFPIPAQTTDCVLQNGGQNIYPTKSNSFNPTDYSSVLLNQAQQYSYYLASGMGLNNPVVSNPSTSTSSSLTTATSNEGEGSTSVYSSYKYPTDNHVSSLPNTFYNPATALLSPTYPSRTDSVNSIFTGLNGQCHSTGYNFIPNASQHSPTAYPFNWANKIRQLAPYTHSGFNPESIVPHSFIPSDTRDYDPFFPRKSSSPLSNGSDSIKPLADPNNYSEHLIKQSANTIDYFRTALPRQNYLTPSIPHPEPYEYLLKHQTAQMTNNRSMYNAPLTQFISNPSAP